MNSVPLSPAEPPPADAPGPAGAPSDTAVRPLADASMLEDRLPLWFRTRPAVPILTAVLGLVFLLFGGLRLWHTDVWGHLAYGRLIRETGRLPQTEPFMPLSRGVEFVDPAWLSQVVGYEMMTRFGVPGLQFLAALCVTTAAGALLTVGYRRTRSLTFALLGLAAFFWLERGQLFGVGLAVLIRPQMTGLAAFLLTLAVVVGRPRRWHWAAVPLLFAAWANLHGSFVMGLTLLGTFALGRAGDVLRRTDKFSAILRDWPFWRLVLLTELAAAAALLNPYGLRLYADVWLLSGNPNLADLVEWKPLTLRTAQGQAAAAVALVLLGLYRATPRRIGTGEALALVGFGGLALWTSRMIVWWAPLAAYCLTLHGSAVWTAHRRRAARKTGAPAVGREPPEPRSLWTVTAVGVAWIFFALTPFAQTLLHGRQDQPGGGLSRQTPIAAAEHLKQEPPVGLVFNTYEYGDYLLWADPGLPVFVAGHAHLAPPDVWRAYVEIVSGNANWQVGLDRYGVNAVLLDRPLRQTFIDRLAEEPGWEKTFEDGVSAVFRRRVPIR